MTKLEVLLIFAGNNNFLKPDHVLNKLRPRPDRRSLYSYLGRLRKQGLLERGPVTRRGQLSYRLTDRGRARLEYFRQFQ
jgi:DNA-binding PadR family transcriptional regulator